ncbi:MAG TPA: PCP reductase family protein, partial [Candidatus Polarisedimenticolia bacterium]|nr:PCP reductase family protein [Candidatus Polarisedimenticolia bacterium]
QVVTSLGVKIEPAADAAGSAAAATSGAAPAATAGAATTRAAGDGTNKEGGGKCPFAEMIPGLMGAGAGNDSVTATTGEPAGASAGSPPAWTDAAVARLEVIPSFVRPMARTGIERFARERGYATIDEKVLDEARLFFGM